jgi:hypothetical protein
MGMLSGAAESLPAAQAAAMVAPVAFKKSLREEKSTDLIS